MEKESIISPKPMFFTGETSFPFVFYLLMLSIVKRCHKVIHLQLVDAHAYGVTVESGLSHM